MRCPWTVVVALLLAGTLPASAVTERDTRRFGPPFKPVTVRVTVGEVEVRAADRADIVVEVEREAPDRAALTRVPIAVDDTETALVVDVTQRDGAHDPAIRTRVTVSVPPAIALDLVSVFEGRISLDGLRGAVTARIERGPLAASRLSGVVRLETKAGDLTLDRADLANDGLLRLRTFNGSIRIGLQSAPRDARVLLLSLNGTITSDLPLAERAGFGPHFREGTFGNAAPLLSADAVRGDIVLTVAR